MRTLAEINPDSLAGQWLMWISGIMLLGALTILVIVVMGVGRRWKRRQLKAIEEDRAARRAGQSAGRVDAWQASAERYIDHDKLPADDERFERDPGAPHEHDDDEPPPGEADEADPPNEDERDPFGLFKDKPYRDPEDEDDFDEEDEDEDEDWDEEEKP